MSNRLFGFLVLLFLLAGLLGVSAVEPGCTPAPRKTSHGEITVEWEDAKLLAPGGYARVHRLNDGSYMAVYSTGGSSNTEFAQLSDKNPYHPGRIIYAANIRPIKSMTGRD